MRLERKSRVFSPQVNKFVSYMESNIFNIDLIGFLHAK